MTEYMRAVFVLSAVLSVSAMLFYKEKKDFSVRFAFATLIVYAALLPILKLVRSPENDISFDYVFDAGDFSEDYREVAEAAFCDGVRRLVSEKYSLDGESVFVFAEEFDFEKMKAGQIRIILSGSAALSDYKGIEKYVNELEIGRCSVEIEIG